jgi:flavin-dependent dehydrogenase
MKNSYDVAIIGGGPAGATFARELARRQPQLKIVLIDGKPKTGSKVCGGLLAPDAQKVLAQFDLNLPKSILADPQIFDVKTMDICSGITRNYQRHYLNMDRGAFDKWLLSLVPENVDIINGRCTEISRCEEGGFRLEIGTFPGNIRAKYIVGADGASSIVRRNFFRPCKKKYIAIQEHFVDNTPDAPSYSCIYDPETSDSCSWTIRKDGKLIFGGAFPQEGGRDAYEKQKERLQNKLGKAFGELVLTEACLLTSPRCAADFVLGKDGAFLVGEAAGFVSASSFEGISSAFLSGKYLADSFCDDPKKTLQSYKKATKKLRFKLFLKIHKMHILCCPLLRFLIMKSGICSIRKYREEKSE